jgi:hypothetical protein
MAMFERNPLSALDKSTASLPLQQSAGLYGQIIQRHLQLRDGLADLRMLSNLLLQRLENLVSTSNMRFRFGRI